MVPVRSAENLKLRAEAQLVSAETALGSAVSAEAKERAERAKAQAAAGIAELQVQLAAAKAELQPKLDALSSRGGAPGGARARAGIGADQPQDPTALRPAGL